MFRYTARPSDQTDLAIGFTIQENVVLNLLIDRCVGFIRIDNTFYILNKENQINFWITFLC